MLVYNPAVPKGESIVQDNCFTKLGKKEELGLVKGSHLGRGLEV